MVRIRSMSCVLCLPLLAASLPAHADITRACSASVEVYVADRLPPALATLGTIEARGSCKNKLNANECRAQAREQIDRCRAQLWDYRHRNEIPVACNTLVEGSSRAGARLDYLGIQVHAEPKRLTARAAAEVCCRMRPKADRVMVSFGGRINGDEKCAAHNIGKDRFQEEFGWGNYDMNCGEWRAKGICG